MRPYDASAVRTTRPPLARPDGFFPFWRDTLAALARVPANPQLGLAVTSPEGARIVPVRFASFGACGIQGFLITLDEPDEPDDTAARRGHHARLQRPV
ncbi:MAG: hypothetical protein J4G16_10415 [Acidobacteria bacterium]|nr:hypothetical protein [Acidobacteriota bacterium]